MNLVNLLFHNSRDRAVIDGHDKYSHEQLKSKSLRVARGLCEELSIKPGHRVAIIANNSIEFLISYLAVLSAGATAIPLNPNSSESERARDITHVRPHLIIASSREWIPESYLEAIDFLEFNSAQWRSFLKKKPYEPVERESQDIAIMMMTSGASFSPRPAMLTHGSLIANLQQAKSIEELNLSKKDVLLGALPMFHIFGLQVVAGLCLSSGACLVIARTFDPIELANIIDHEKVSIVPGVPILFDAFLRNPSITIDSLNKVRMFVSGGAPMRNDVRMKFFERFGSYIAEGYGLTEASPMISFTPNAKWEGDIGKLLEGVDVDIRDSSGSMAIEGDAGEIVVRGKNVFAGYFGEREATSRVLDPSGWLFTGDIGVRDEDGNITLIDRSSDVIVVHGFSVYPSEVENVLIECDLVEQVSVVGALDEKSGEAVLAYIRLSGDKKEGEDPKIRRGIELEIREFCVDKLARYKIPARIEFIEELDVGASTRPLRKTLRSALRNIEG